MHTHPQPSPYLAHQVQQLPSMPPPSTPYQDSVPMAGPGALQPGPSADGAQSASSQPQERAPLTAEQKRQQELNLRPYSSEDDQNRVYS
jgi:hypothetical protein